ncbi:hypothetical protein Tco_1403453 [Tanacetum coccineum]
MDCLSGADVAVSDELVSSITQVANLFLAGNCPQMLGEYIASAPLTPLIKSGGGIHGLQFGVGVSGGSEAILHAVNRLIEGCGDDVGLSMLLVDFKNAFNLVDREVMLREVRLRCPAISPWVEFCYSDPARFVFCSTDQYGVFSQLNTSYRPSDRAAESVFHIHIVKMKGIKEESEILGLLMIDDDLFTCDTPLGTIFNELNRLSRMDDDLFTYEEKIPELSYSLSVGQQMDNLDNGNLDVYERKLCYDECEKMYAEAVIFIDKRLESVIATWLIRSYKKQFEDYMEIKKQKEVYGLDKDMEYDPSNIDFSEWLASKFSNHMMMDWYTKNALWIYWTRGYDEEVITDDELSDLGDGNLIDETEVAEIFRIETDIFQLETPICEAFKKFNYLLKIDVDVLTIDIPGFKSYDEYKDAWIYEWNKDVPWVANMPWLDYGPWMEPSDDIEHVCKPFRFTNGHAKWPTCNWKKEKYCDEGELKDEALNSKAISEGSKGVDEESRKNSDYETRENEGWFDEHELMEDDDDDIGDLEDYLIRKDHPYYVNEEEERFRERRCKLLGIPYVKPPTCKSEKFKVVKYSFGPTEEYVAIKEYEYDIWVRAEDNVS